MFFGYIWKVLLIIVFEKASASEELSYFRILAPEIVCPKDENSVIDKPDNTIVTLHTQAEDLQFNWTVRWAHMESPGQRFTLLLWKSVRALEAQLNGPQSEPFVYIINNVDLLRGVEYIFNVTGIKPQTNVMPVDTKSFHIDNIKGDPKLIVDGRSDKFSVYLAGGDIIYTDMEYVLEAEVTTCSPNRAYYFIWKVRNRSGNTIDVSDISGMRLQIPAYSVEVGNVYHVTCFILKNNSDIVTRTDLPFQVLYRGLKVYLSVDTLIVTIGYPFKLSTYVDNRDYYGELPSFNWSCINQNETCSNFVSADGDVLEFPEGISDVGEYIITVKANVLEQNAVASATINTVEPILPVIEVEPVSRIVNEGSFVQLIANASNVAPTCTITWYFASDDYLNNLPDDCDECQHGEPLSDSITITSLEENFLSELADFTNDTEWRQITVQVPAGIGRARFYAKCGCSLTFSCQTEGEVYADVYLQLNKGPEVGQVKISPETGTAMETVFRISKPVATDPDKPLRYTLYCGIGDNSLVMASNLQHLAVDVFLPFSGTVRANIHRQTERRRRGPSFEPDHLLEVYLDVNSLSMKLRTVFLEPNGTTIWIEVCDSLGACSTSFKRSVSLSPGEGRTVQVLLDDVREHVARCELMLLNRVVQSAIFTYANAEQSEPLSYFIKCLLEALPASDEEHCLKRNPDYSILLHWLASYGVDTSDLI